MGRKSGTVVPIAAAPPAPLTEAEGADLARLEATVEKGYASFMEVGEALAKIGKRRLYRATHATFEDYCRERWHMGANYARKQIRAAKVVGVLGGPGAGKNGTRVPTSERVARPLTKVGPAKQRSAWRTAVKDAQRAGRKDPTPQDVEHAVGELVLNGSGKIDKLASQRAAREAQAAAHEASIARKGDTRRVRHLREALAHLQAAAKADDDRWAAKIGAQADRVDTLLHHVLMVDRR